MSRGETALLTLGLTGQSLFFMRFFLQWLHSERERRSVIPRSFWYYSLAGSTLLLVYAVIRRDVVFIVGQGSGFFIYLRNLRLLARERRTRGEHP